MVTTLVVLVSTLGVNYVFADEETFSFFLDKVWYQPRDVIQISGWVNMPGDSEISIEIINPENLVIKQETITLADQEIDLIIPTLGNEWETTGFYQVKINFGSEIQTRFFAFGNFDPVEFEPQITFDKTSYSWTDTVKITVLSPIDNQYNNQIDEIKVEVSSNAGKLSSYVLEETGLSHGIFSGIVTLTGHPDYDVDGDGRKGDATGLTHGSGPEEGNLSVYPNDKIKLIFSTGYHEETLEKNVPVQFQLAEVLWLDEIEPNQNSRIRVIDHDMALRPEFRDRVQVLVGLSPDHSLEDLLLEETGDNNGIFEGVVKFADNQSNEGIVIYPGNTVFLKYEDRTLPSSYSTKSLEIIAEATVIGSPEDIISDNEASGFDKATCLSQRETFQKSDSDLYLVNHWPIKGEWFVEGYGDMNTTILGDIVNLSEIPLTDIKISVKTFRGGQLLEEESSWYPIKKILRPNEASPFVITPTLTGFDNYQIWVKDYKTSCDVVTSPKSTITSILIDTDNSGQQTLSISCNPILPTREIGAQYLLFVTYTEDYFIEFIEIGPSFFFDSYECFGKGHVDITSYLDHFKENRLELFVIESPKTLVYSEKDIRVQTLIQSSSYSKYYPDSLHPKHMNLDEIRTMAEKGGKIQTPTTVPKVFDEKEIAIESLNLQGTLALEAGKYWDAISWFDNTLVHDPNNIEALYNKGLAFEALGLDDDAQSLFDKVKNLESPQIIPQWIRGNAAWWAQGAIGNSDFVSGIQYLIKEGIMTIPETTSGSSGDGAQEIPSWIKNNADWWAQGLISDDDFVKGIQFLVEQGIIIV
jgi:hypothetical protein